MRLIAAAGVAAFVSGGVAAVRRRVTDVQGRFGRLRDRHEGRGDRRPPPERSTVRFLAGSTMTINGRRVLCLAPPENGQSPPPELCPDWPAAVKLGTSNVTVYYWDTPFEGVSTPVTAKLTAP